MERGAAQGKGPRPDAQEFLKPVDLARLDADAPLTLRAALEVGDGDRPTAEA